MRRLDDGHKDAAPQDGDIAPVHPGVQSGDDARRDGRDGAGKGGASSKGVAVQSSDDPGTRPYEGAAHHPCKDGRKVTEIDDKVGVVNPAEGAIHREDAEDEDGPEPVSQPRRPVEQ